MGKFVQALFIFVLLVQQIWLVPPASSNHSYNASDSALVDLADLAGVSQAPALRRIVKSASFQPVNQDDGSSDPLPPAWLGDFPLVSTTVITAPIEIDDDLVEQPRSRGLYLDSTLPFALPGNNLELDWQALDLDLPASAQLQLTLPPELTLLAINGQPPAQDTVGQPILMPEPFDSGQLQLGVQDFALGPFSITLQAIHNEQILAEKTLTLPASGIGLIASEGGSVRHPGDWAAVSFSADPARSPLRIQIGPVPAENTPTELLEGPLFQIRALDDLAQEPATSFDEAITVQAQIEPGLAYAGIYFFDEFNQTWEPLPSSYDPETGQVEAVTTHFTVFSISAATDINANIPTLDSFQVSESNGAAVTSYPIWTPPGIAGVQPSLSLSYNSQAMDSFVPTAQQVSWVGGGWSLDVGYIDRDTHGTPGNNASGDDTYNLVVNGVSMRLLHTSAGTYHAESETYWKVEYDAGSDQWTAYDTSGAKYTFGGTSDSNSRYFTLRNANQCSYPIEYVTWRWGLRRVDPPFGSNPIEYTYEEDTLPQNDVNCDPDDVYSSDVAQYPETITYANGMYRIDFVLEERDDRGTSWSDPDRLLRFHSDSRLDSIEIYGDLSGSAPFTADTLIRKYTFTYGDSSSNSLFPGYTYAMLGKAFALLNIQETVLQGQSYPATQYTYADRMHLTKAENGYGGSVEFTYNIWYDEDTRLDSNKIFSDRSGTCPWDWDHYSNWSIVDAECYNDYVVIDGQPFSAGDPLEPFSGRIFPQYGFGSDSYQPGGAYLIEVKAKAFATGGSVYVDLDYPQGSVNLANGVPVSSWNSTTVRSIFIAPPNPSGETIYHALRLRIGRGPYQTLYLDNETDVYLLTTRYRVTQKTVRDAWSSEAYTWSYSYDEAAVNDRTHSAVAAGNTDPSRLYTPIGAEFRGNASFYEYGPVQTSGQQTARMSWLYQSDEFKSMALRWMTGEHDYIEQFESTSLPSGWVGTLGSTLKLERQQGDLALSLVPGAGSVSVQRSPLRQNGQALLVHFRPEAGGETRLQVESGAGKAFGIYINTSGTVYSELQTAPGSSTLTPLGMNVTFNQWHLLILVLDNGHLYLRIQPRDAATPVKTAEFPDYDAGSNTTWYFRAWQSGGGKVSLDTYWEGTLLEFGQNTFESTATYYNGNYVSKDVYLANFDDLQFHWQRPTVKTRIVFEGTGAWRASANYYFYETAQQGDKQWGNTTHTVQAYFEVINGVNTPRATLMQVSRYTPTTGSGFHLTSLPYASESYACPAGVTPASCVASPGSATLLAASYNIFDNHGVNPAVAPSTGKLTEQRTLVSSGAYNDVKYQYDSYGNRTHVTQCASTGSSSQFATGCYNPSVTTYGVTPVYPSQVANPLNQSTSMVYDRALGAPLQETDPNNVTSTAVYDSLGRMVKLILPGDDANNPTVRLTYSLNSTWTRLQIETRITGSTYSITQRYYDGLGRVVQTRTPGSILDGYGSTPQTVAQDTWYAAGGQAVKANLPYVLGSTSEPPVRNASAAAVQSEYDAAGRLVEQTQPDSAQTRTVYTLPPRSTGDARLGLFVTSYDALNRATQAQQDLWGQTLQIFPAINPGVSYTYDALGRLTQAVYGSVTQTSLTYDLGGRKTAMVDADMGGWTYVYDALGRLKEQTDARGCEVEVFYDALRRPTSRLYSGTLTECQQTGNVTYTYDQGSYGIGRLHEMTDKSGTTTWTYDARGRVETELRTFPASNVFTTEYDYYSNDALASITYPLNNSGALGEKVSYTYHPQMALSTAVSDNSTPTDSTDDISIVQQSGYDAVGRIRSLYLGATSASPNPTVRLGYSYYSWTDQALVDGQQTGQGGRLARATAYSNIFTDNFSTTSLNARWQWYRPDSRTSYSLTEVPGSLRLKLPSSAAFNHWTTVDNAPQMRQTAPTGDWAIETKATVSYSGNNFHGGLMLYFGQYDIAYWGFMQGTGLGLKRSSSGSSTLASATNSASTVWLRISKVGNVYSFEYKTSENAAWSVAGTQTWSGAPTKVGVIVRSWQAAQVNMTFDDFRVHQYQQDIQYVYDWAGNLKSKITPSAAETYTYDAMNRLIGANPGGTYTYSTTTGNLDSTTSAGNYAYGITQPHAVLSVTGKTYVYDQNGNQTRRTIGSDVYDLIYDGENRLITVKKNNTPIASFTYDASGQRVKSVIGGETIFFVGKHFEWSSSTGAKKHYFAGSTLLAVRAGTTDPQWLITDHLGSVTKALNYDGSEITAIQYNPWGDHADNPLLPTKYTYTGQYSYALDADDFGLLYYNARWYDPSLGRFAQADSIIPNPGNPLDYDRYAYARNNALKYADPSGHTPLPLFFFGSFFGVTPDFEGLLVAIVALNFSGSTRIDVAAGIAVQSQWLNPYDYIDTGQPGHGMGIAQVSWQQMHEYGIKGDPRDPKVAVQAMTERIDLVTRMCNGCTPYDKLVASAMAQNGPGFNAAAMKYVVNNYMEDGNINWVAFFEERGPKGDINDLRAVGRDNFDTRYMVFLYALDLYTLYLAGWDLPDGITADDLHEMMNLGWGTNNAQ